MLGERVLVIGSPGGGKSTFARRLALLSGLPLTHLDMLFWNSDRTTVSKEEFRRRLDEVLQRDRWLIDGNYSGTMEHRMERCQTIFFLDFPVDPEFMEFIREFPEKRRPGILALQEKYSEKHWVVFHSRGEEEAYLRGFQEGNLLEGSGQS